MKNLTFNKFIKLRTNFLNENKNKDHIIINGKNNILISAPHGVCQVRLGKFKAQEIGSLSTALFLKESTDCFFIAKTKCNNDDVNFDDKSKYKNSIKKLIKEKGVNYIIDIHGLASHRGYDVNLGTHLGNNIENNIEIFDKLNNLLVNNGFKVGIDLPFMANSKTICSSIKKEFNNVWTLQVEIDCSITNKKENFEKNIRLLKILIDWLNEIK